MKNCRLPLALLSFAPFCFTACVETTGPSRPSFAKPVSIAVPVPEPARKEVASKPVSKNRTTITYKKYDSAKATIEPKMVKWTNNTTAGKVNRPYVYTPPKRSNAPEAVSGSRIDIVSSSEIQTRLNNHGIDFSSSTPLLAQGIQIDEIPVGLDRPSLKDIVLVEVNNSNETIEANGRDVVVLGSTSKVTITGNCGKLIVVGKRNVINTNSVTNIQVHGNSNHLTLGDIGAGELHGDYNRVDWTRPGIKPSFVIDGSANQVAAPR